MRTETPEPPLAAVLAATRNSNQTLRKNVLSGKSGIQLYAVFTKWRRAMGKHLPRRATKSQNMAGSTSARHLPAHQRIRLHIWSCRQSVSHFFDELWPYRTREKTPAVVFSFFSRKCALRDIFSVTNMIEDLVGRGFLESTELSHLTWVFCYKNVWSG